MARPARAITTTGGLLPSELLDTLANDPGALRGTDPSHYHLGERRLRDAINRSWAELNGAWASFRTELEKLPTGERATSLTRERWLLHLMQELGFGWLPYLSAGLQTDGTTYPISHCWGAVPIHLLGADVPLDRRTRGVTGAASSSPHSLVQDFLNRSDAHLWGVLSNGRVLRLLRDHTSLTRPAYVEFDLEAIFNGQSFTDFVVLWMLCHQSRFEGDPPESCWLERWADQARTLGVRALDALRGGFEAAIARLGSGFLAHPANRPLRDALRDGTLDRHDYHRQVLRLVYRLVFLLVAEDRDLLHPPDADPTARSRYQSYYSLSHLRALASRRSSPRHDDLYAALGPVFAALAGPGADGLGLAGFGSFLWSPGSCPDLDSTRLANVDLLAAVRRLAFTQREGAVYRVDFANLGAEELGGVYESLLELHPDVNAAAATYRLAAAPGHERKTTGSYYTPTSLVSELLDSALDPLLDEADRSPDPAAALLGLKVLDPACGSGHFLIAAANRIALRLAAVRQNEVAPTPEAVRQALREVIGHCIYGIDQNPMAVELAKVNLWLETMEPGLPLSFLDHHIACGNALLGATPDLVGQPIPDDAYKALTGDDRDTAAAWRKVNSDQAKKLRKGISELALGTPLVALVASLADQAAAVDALPDATPEEVEAKAVAYATYSASADASPRPPLCRRLVRRLFPPQGARGCPGHHLGGFHPGGGSRCRTGAVGGRRVHSDPARLLALAHRLPRGVPSRWRVLAGPSAASAKVGLVDPPLSARGRALCF